MDPIGAPTDPTPETPPRLRARARALAFAAALPALQAVARDHGYALAVHGSMATDLDLIAVPWVETAVDAATLAEALRECIGGFKSPRDHHPVWKPHGRLCWSFFCNEECDGPYLDVSILPRRRKNAHFCSEEEMGRLTKEVPLNFDPLIE